MSPDTDEYWVGGLAMALAIGHYWLRNGRTDIALRVISKVLVQFSMSPVCDDNLRRELAEYWPAEMEGWHDDRNVLRPLRSGDPG
jgi:hypothetical protein